MQSTEREEVETEGRLKWTSICRKSERKCNENKEVKLFRSTSSASLVYINIEYNP